MCLAGQTRAPGVAEVPGNTGLGWFPAPQVPACMQPTGLPSSTTQT